MTRETIDQKSKIVLIHGMGREISGKKPALLLSTTQIEEIIHTVKIFQIPFAPDYLAGACLWRKQILPVIDICSRYGFDTEETAGDKRYIVVKSAGVIKGEKYLLQGALEIPSRIEPTELPASSSPAKLKSSDIDKKIVKGAFVYRDTLMIIPDLANILGSK